MGAAYTINKALSHHYVNRGRSDYFDKNVIGKFIAFLAEHGFD